MKKRIVIHGAGLFGQGLIMKLDYIFDIVAILDRNKNLNISEFCPVPHYDRLDIIKELEFDYILVTNTDYEGVQREYSIFYDIPESKIINMQTGHQEPKRRLFYCLANEIYRQNIPGATVELGVDFGDTAKYINFFFPDRKLYLFDTFTGFSEQDVEHERNLNSFTENMKSYYDDRTSSDMVLRRMYYPEKCVIKKGVFPDSLDGLEDRFAFVHIDCDLSKPITSALEYFYPRLSPGGFICIHDYYNPRFPGVRPTVRQFCEQNDLPLIPDPYFGGVVIGKSGDKS